MNYLNNKRQRKQFCEQTRQKSLTRETKFDYWSDDSQTDTKENNAL